MNISRIGNVIAWILSLYFIVSGLLAAADVDAKLLRIGLAALNDDGKTAFLLIYTSLMVGIGLSMLLIQHASKSWRFSLMLAGTIIFSFITFRVVSAVILGNISETQIAFILTELVELGVILSIFFWADRCLKQTRLTSRSSGPRDAAA